MGGELRCPGCGASSPIATTCDGCAVTFIDPRDRTARTTVRSLVRDPPTWAWVSLVCVVVPCILLSLLHSALGGSPPSVALLALLVALAMVLTWWISDAPRREAAHLRGWLDLPHTTPAAQIEQPGVASITGRVVEIERSLHVDGRACVVDSRLRDRGPLSPALITHMVEHVIEEPSGARVLVRASDAVVSTDSREPSWHAVIPVGAEVTVRGWVKRVVGTDGDYRTTPMQLELSDEGGEPLRFRLHR